MAAIQEKKEQKNFEQGNSEALQKRLEELQAQWNKGQEMLQGHQKEIQTIQSNMLRIEGAMILVKEFISKESK